MEGEKKRKKRGKKREMEVGKVKTEKNKHIKETWSRKQKKKNSDNWRCKARNSEKQWKCFYNSAKIRN